MVERNTKERYSRGATLYFSFFCMSIGKGLKAGLFTGIIAAIIVNIWIYVYYAVADVDFSEVINVVSATLVTLIANLLGGIFFALIAKKSFKAATWSFAIITILVAAGMTWNTYAAPAVEGFETVSSVSHYIVTLVSIILMPLLFKKHMKKTELTTPETPEQPTA